MIKAVLFDLDDTLYREYDFVEQAFGNAAAVMERHLMEKHFAGRHLAEGRLTERDVAEKQAAGTRKEGESTKELLQQMLDLLEKEGRGAIFNRLCERHRADIPVEELVKVYRETVPVLSLYPDGEELLAWLEEKQILTGLITDGNAQVQRRKIRALGLDKRMDVVLVSDEVSRAKPDPEVYFYCMKKLGCAPEETVYIGDNPSKDFVGARKIGMRTVRIVRSEGMYMGRKAAEGYEAEITVCLLTEVKMWLEQIGT